MKVVWRFNLAAVSGYPTSCTLTTYLVRWVPDSWMPNVSRHGTKRCAQSRALPARERYARPLTNTRGRTALATDLKSPAGHCRWKAVEELRRLGDKRAVPLLETMAHDDTDGNVRHYARQAADRLQNAGSRR